MGFLFNFLTPMVSPFKNDRSVKKRGKTNKKKNLCSGTHPYNRWTHLEGRCVYKDNWKEIDRTNIQSDIFIIIHILGPMLLSLKNELHTLVSMRPTSHEWQTEV